MKNKISTTSKLLTQEVFDDETYTLRLSACKESYWSLFQALFPNRQIVNHPRFIEIHKLENEQLREMLRFETVIRIDAVVKQGLKQTALIQSNNSEIVEIINAIQDSSEVPYLEGESVYCFDNGTISRYSKSKMKSVLRRRKVLTLNFLHGKSRNDIAQQVRFSRQHVDRIIADFESFPTKVVNNLKLPMLIKLSELRILENVDKILDDQEKGLSIKALKNEIESKLGIKFAKTVCLRRYLRKNGYRYKGIKKTRRRTDLLTENIRAFLVCIIDKIHDRKPVFYFDATSIMNGSFKKKSWYKRGENFRPKNAFTYDHCHILGMISGDSLEALQIVKGQLNRECIMKFFVRFLHYVRQKLPIQTRIFIVIDNATIHKGHQLNNLCRTLNAELLFIIPNTPCLNAIELFWRDIKAPLRTRFWMNSSRALQSILERAQKIPENSFRAYENQYLEMWQALKNNPKLNFSSF